MTTEEEVSQKGNPEWGRRLDRFMDQWEKTETRCRDEGGARLFAPGEAEALADLIDQRIQVFGNTLRREIAKTHELHRQEMTEKIRIQWILTGILLIQTLFHALVSYLK